MKTQLNTQIVQEFQEGGPRHRLVNKATGEKTGWAEYSQIAVMAGHVSASAYYLDKEAVISPQDFCNAIGVGVPTPEGAQEVQS